MNVPGPKRFPIPEGSAVFSCRSCRAPIVFIVTDAGKRMPVNLDGISHFATCDDPERFRKKKGKAQR